VIYRGAASAFFLANSSLSAALFFFAIFRLMTGSIGRFPAVSVVRLLIQEPSSISAKLEINSVSKPDFAKVKIAI